jgi:hypothetical protein
MRTFRPLLICAALAIGSQAAIAQTPMAPAPGVTPPPERITATTTDPLVQKRMSNAAANQDYKANKKAAARRYKAAKRKAATERKLEHKDAENAAKANMTSPPAPAPGTGQVQQ